MFIIFAYYLTKYETYMLNIPYNELFYITKILSYIILYLLMHVQTQVCMTVD